jgi:GAF domain-containing protein
MSLVELQRIVEDVGVSLDADRCWLYARDPEHRVGIALVRWRRSPDVTDVPENLNSWTPEAADLPLVDPLFARALGGRPADAIADANVDRCNADLERILGHRAFVHLNLHVDGVLWGTLQPGMTTTARHWSEAEQQYLLALRQPLARLVADIVRTTRMAD